MSQVATLFQTATDVSRLKSTKSIGDKPKSMKMSA